MNTKGLSWYRAALNTILLAWKHLHVCEEAARISSRDELMFSSPTARDIPKFLNGELHSVKPDTDEDVIDFSARVSTHIVVCNPSPFLLCCLKRRGGHRYSDSIRAHVIRTLRLVLVAVAVRISSRQIV